jgi:hypothetical protein
MKKVITLFAIITLFLLSSCTPASPERSDSGVEALSEAEASDQAIEIPVNIAPTLSDALCKTEGSGQAIDIPVNIAPTLSDALSPPQTSSVLRSERPYLP